MFHTPVSVAQANTWQVERIVAGARAPQRLTLRVTAEQPARLKVAFAPGGKLEESEVLACRVELEPEEDGEVRLLLTSYQDYHMLF